MTVTFRRPSYVSDDNGPLYERARACMEHGADDANTCTGESEMKSKRTKGLFYLQDLLDDIARADAEWFARLCENGGQVSRCRSKVKSAQQQALPLVQEQVA